MRNRRNVRNNKNITEFITNRNFIIISTALIVIIIIAIGILGYKQYKDKELLAKQKQELENQTQEIFTALATPATPEAVNGGTTTAKISAVGDILCGADMIEDAKQGDTYDFTHMFEKITKFVNRSDISVGTLETNFISSSDYSEIGKYNSPIEFLQAVKKSGINMISVAHNHSLDYKEEGLEETISKIQEAGMDITGNKNENEETNFTGIIKEVKGIKVAVLGYTYGLSNSADLSEEEKSKVNLYSEERVMEDLKYAKENSNYILVIMHWGEVNDSSISSWQKQVKDFLVENGADAILGSHPSVIEPMEILQNADGKNVLVAYSLGNYISSLKYENADVELILNIEITKEADSDKAELKKVDYTPIYVLDNGKKVENRFELVDMKGLAIDYANGNQSKISKKTYTKLINKIEWLNKIIKSNN